MSTWYKLNAVLALSDRWSYVYRYAYRRSFWSGAPQQLLIISVKLSRVSARYTDYRKLQELFNPHDVTSARYRKIYQIFTLPLEYGVSRFGFQFVFSSLYYLCCTTRTYPLENFIQLPTDPTYVKWSRNRTPILVELLCVDQRTHPLYRCLVWTLSYITKWFHPFASLCNIIERRYTDQGIYSEEAST